MLLKVREVWTSLFCYRFRSHRQTLWALLTVPSFAFWHVFIFTVSLFPSSQVGAWMVFIPYPGQRESMQVFEHVINVWKFYSMFKEKKTGQIWVYWYLNPATRTELGVAVLPHQDVRIYKSKVPVSDFCELQALFCNFLFLHNTHKTTGHLCTNLASFCCDPLRILHGAFTQHTLWNWWTSEKSVQQNILFLLVVQFYFIVLSALAVTLDSFLAPAHVG